MGGSAIGKQLGYGFVGKITSSEPRTTVTNRTVKSTDTNNVNFGDPVVLNTDNTYSKFGASNTAAQFAGVAVAEVKQSSLYLNAENGTSYYAPGDQADVLRTGKCIVNCTEGTPTAGGAVYIVTVAGAGAVSAVGNFIANATPAGTSSAAVKLTNVVWATGNMDSSNSAEIEVLNPITA